MSVATASSRRQDRVADPDAAVASTVARIVQRRWAAFGAAVALAYVAILGALLLSANVGRGLIALETEVLGGDDAGVWLGVLAYLQGAALLAAAVVLPLAGLLAATVELTRGGLTGGRTSPWQYVARSGRRAPSVARALVALAIRLAVVLLLSGVLLVLSAITLPVALLTALVWIVRPGWRRSWMSWPLVIAAPFGVLVQRTVRWSLWLPYAVAGTRGRHALRASAGAVSGRWLRTARPLVAMGLIAVAVGIAGAVLVRLGAPSWIATAATVLAALVLVLGASITSTVLHDRFDVAPPEPPRSSPRLGMLVPSPGLAVVVVMGIVAQGLVLAGAVAPAGADPVALVVNTLIDAPAPDLDVECATPVAPCTLRAAVLIAAAENDLASTITFGVSGSIALTSTLWIGGSMTIDGAGNRVSLTNGGAGRLVQIGGASGEGEGSSPALITLRNLTISGARSGDGAGVLVAAGSAIIESATFVDNIAAGPDTLGGGAIMNAATLLVRNTTFSGNHGVLGQPQGGAVINWGNLVVVNSTFVDGGGVGSISSSATTEVWNSVFRGALGNFNCDGTDGGGTDHLVGGHNLSNDDTCPTEPGMTRLGAADFALGVLGDNGGDVDTFALLPESLAIGAGDEAHCPTTDARGEARPIGVACDAGSYQAERGTFVEVESLVNPSRFGDAVAITVVVTHPESTPTGSVTVDGLPGDALEATLVSGQATFELEDLPVGDNVLTVAYVPDGALDAASTEHVQEVEQQESAATLVVAPTGQSLVGDEITLTATVRNLNNANGPVPTGDVELLDGATVLSTEALDEGAASLEIELDGGPHTLTARYVGATGFTASTSPAVIHRVQSVTSVELDAPESSVYGDPFEVTITVDGEDGVPVPTGDVRVDSSGTPGSIAGLAAGSLDPDGTLTVSVVYPSALTTPAAGEHELTVTYLGDDHNAASVSEPVDHLVEAAPTETTLTGPSASTQYSADAVFTATVDAIGSDAVPTGDVELDVDGDVVTVALDDGEATLTTGTLGTTDDEPHRITATYVPDHDGFTGSSSDEVEHEVTIAPTTLALTGPAASVFGQVVELVATASSPAPSGTITFKSGATTVGTASLASGVARLSTGSLAMGAHEITAVFAGDADHEAATSPELDHAVSKASTAVEVTADPEEPVSGDEVVLTATVAAVAPGGGTPTGVVRFEDDGELLGVAAIDAGGVADLSLPTLSAGSHAITASYAGSTSYLADDGALTLDVAEAETTIAVVATPSPAMFGAPVTLTATVESSTGSEPTGTVTFSWISGSIGTVPLVDGVATLTTSSLMPTPCLPFPTGCITATPHASYSGDGDHAGVVTTELDPGTGLRVTKGTYPLNITTDASPSSYGQSVRITADMGGPRGGRVPDTVTIRVVGHDVRMLAFDEDGQATWEIEDLPPGQLRIMATGTGDSWFAEQTVEILHDVNKANAAIALSASPASPRAGEPYVLTATLTPARTASIGTVRFFDGDALLGEAAVDGSSTASLSTVAGARGLRTITAVYDGGVTRFNVTQAMLSLVVRGRAVSLSTINAMSRYGDVARLEAVVFTTDPATPLPTGTVAVSLDGVGRGAAVVSAAAVGGLVLAPVSVSLGSDIEVGSHELTVTYSGDVVHDPVTTTAYVTVVRRATTTEIEVETDPARVGEPVMLRGRVELGGITPRQPTGQLVLGGGGQTCVAALDGTGTSGSCTVTFPARSRVSIPITATYSGDARFAPSTSSAHLLDVGRNEALMDVQASFRDVNDTLVWLTDEPVHVTWAVTGEHDVEVEPVGLVEVWSDGVQQRSCPSDPVASCDVPLRTASAMSTIEVRFLGDDAFLEADGDVSAPVRGCFAVTAVAPGRVVTPPTCGTRYIAGTDVELDTTVAPGYRLVGWGFGASARRALEQSPLRVAEHVNVQPRFEPLCVELVARVRPTGTRVPTPDPLPNCDDPQAPDYRVLDLFAIRNAEVAAGIMRYRVGTTVTLGAGTTVLPIGAAGETLEVAWSGDGVGRVAGRSVVTMDASRSVIGDYTPACRRFDVVGSDEVDLRITGSRLEPTRQTSLLTQYLPTGRCALPSGTGFLTGTTVTVTAAVDDGFWFEGFGAVVPRQQLPTVAAAPTPRQAPLTPAVPLTSTFTVPAFDAGVTGRTGTVTCAELRVEIVDAVEQSMLRTGNGPPTVATSPSPNCPSTWLARKGVIRPRADQPQPKWYVVGTPVTLTASTAPRFGFVEEHLAERPIEFKKWSGATTGTLPTTSVLIADTTTVRAEWFVASLCARIIVHALPSSGGGEVATSDLGDECPVVTNQGIAIPQARLKTPVTLGARPIGSLVPIWQIQGDSVSNTTACTERTSYVELRRTQLRADGLSTRQIEETLMELGYVPGWVMLQIESIANDLFSKGVKQAEVIADLKLRGLLDSSGAPVPDELQPDPCADRRRNTVIPPGEPVISFDVDGHTTATAWFCKPVIPAVVVFDIDGVRHDITGRDLDVYAPLFRSRGSNGVSADCPADGYYLAGSTPVFGAAGAVIAGHRIESWSVDGVVTTSGTVSLPITPTGAPPRLTVTLRVQCHPLTVNAPFGSHADPAPNCPFAPAVRGLYTEGTKVVVGAGQSSGHVWQGWDDAKYGLYNPAVVEMTGPKSLTARFRAKSVGETIQSAVVDPMVDALAVGSKKVVGGIAFVTKTLAGAVIEQGLLRGLSALGSVLEYGLGQFGVKGQVLDGIVVGLQQPKASFGAAMAGFDCVEAWAWGSSLPTLGQMGSIVTSAVSPSAQEALEGVSTDSLVADARALAARAARGDPDAIAQLSMSTVGVPQLAMAALAKDIMENPDAWLEAGDASVDRAADIIEKRFSNGFEWESSASEAWTSGGDALAKCMADSGRGMAGQ